MLSEWSHSLGKFGIASVGNLSFMLEMCIKTIETVH